MESQHSRLRKLVEEGKWPPKGHPWEALFKLPPQEVLQWFKLPVGVALLAGLQALLQLARDQQAFELRGKPIDTDKLYELRSLIDGYEKLLNLPSEVEQYGLAIAEKGRTSSDSSNREAEREIARRDDSRIAETLGRVRRRPANGY